MLGLTLRLRKLPRGAAILYAVLAVAAAVAIVFGLDSVYGFLGGSSSSSAAQRTATVAYGTVQSSVTASGNVSVATSASANFGTSGTLTAVKVAVGDHVQAGQVLARIDPTSAQSSVQVAEANLTQARSALQAAEAGPTAAQSASNASSLEQAQSQLTSAQQQLASDRTAVSDAAKQLSVDSALACPPAGTTSSATSSSGSSAASSAAASLSNNASSNGGGSSTGSSLSSSGLAQTPSGSGVTSATTSRKGIEVRFAGPTGPSGPATRGATGAKGVTGAAGTTTTATTTTGTTTTATPTTITTTPTTTPTTASKGATGAKGTAGGTSTSASKGGTGASGASAAPSGASSTTKSKPAVATGQASGIGSSTAALAGTVDPSGAATTYYFEYGTSASRLDSKTAKMSAGSGSLSVSVTASLKGLAPGRTYTFRLVAKNDVGTVDGAEDTLTTLSVAPPDATTGSASSVLTRSATLNATVTPNGSDTTYRFEYGTSTGYGKRTAAADAGSGTSATQVSTVVTGLEPDTAYLFRVVATNSSGTATGIGQIVKTSASSCVQDASTITSAKQAVTQQQQTVDTAESNLTQTRATIASSEVPSAATIAQDKAAVTQAQVTLQSDRQALAATTLRAPVSGTVTAVDDAVGATVGGSGSSVSRGASNASSGASSAGTGLGAASAASSSSSASSSTFATIETLDDLEVVSGFAEADAGRLAVGEPATITFPALTNTEVAGKVVAVSSTSTVVSNVVTYDATIALVNPPSEVKEGMTANVSVVVQTRGHVLELPSSAITTNGTISTVQLLQNGKTTVTPIQIGLVGDSSTEIVGGIALGAVVVVPTVSITAAAASTTGTGGVGGFGGLAGLGGGGGGGGFGRGG